MELDENFDNALRSLVTARPTVDCMYANSQANNNKVKLDHLVGKW